MRFHAVGIQDAPVISCFVVDELQVREGPYGTGGHAVVVESTAIVTGIVSFKDAAFHRQVDDGFSIREALIDRTALAGAGVVDEGTVADRLISKVHALKHQSATIVKGHISFEITTVDQEARALIHGAVLLFKTNCATTDIILADAVVDEVTAGEFEVAVGINSVLVAFEEFDKNAAAIFQAGVVFKKTVSKDNLEVSIIAIIGLAP